MLPLVYDGTGASRTAITELLGSKAANLLELERLRLSVPPFYVVTCEAFRQTADPTELARRTAIWSERIRGEDSAGASDATADIRQWLQQLELSVALQDAIRIAHQRKLSVGSFLAVRSSVAGEDSPHHSFAGMHDTLLGLRDVEDVFDAIKRVWASAFCDRALMYRRYQDLAIANIGVAVIVQQMIDARTSGVMFTCNPATGNTHQTMICARRGLGDQLVSGKAQGDTYHVDKETWQISAQLTEQTDQTILGQSGLETISVDGQEQNHGSLSAPQVLAVAKKGQVIERHYGRPQDVEFCIDANDELFILQARPVTQLKEYGPAAGNHLIWDNSNIIESYSGVTTPMTFSFIRRVYSIVYHCFGEVMGVSPSVIQANRQVYDNMLGLFRGRVYYNLKNWYRSLRMFPGFQYNSRFMESMMGLKEPLDLEDAPPSPGRLRRWFIELPALIRLLVRSTWNFGRIRKTARQFDDNFHRHYAAWQGIDFNRMAPHELQSLYHEMEEALLWDWKAPIINDFFVMIFYGVLKKLCESWCGDETGSLANELLCGEGGVASAEPAKMLLQLTKLAQDNPRLRDAILKRPLEDLPHFIASQDQFAEFSSVMQNYLDLYGFRCVNELKLEEFSLKDRPHLVYMVIRNYLLLDNPAALDVTAIAAREQKIRRTAQQQAFTATNRTRSLWPRKLILRWVLKNARLGVKNRENMRFARTRIFGLLRQMLRALGQHFNREGILDNVDDIFYLTIDEIWDFVKGTAVTTDLRGLAQLRRVEFDSYARAEAAPDDRFETYGIAYHRNPFHHRDANADPVCDGTLRGTGCCPGDVTGSAQVVVDPTRHAQLDGNILVAERTDPGWVPLYPAVSGILIERGSILSHSAVVAREMGIPTIVGITGLISTVNTGDLLRMDGRAGSVEILSDPADQTTSSTQNVP